MANSGKNTVDVSFLVFSGEVNPSERETCAARLEELKARVVGLLLRINEEEKLELLMVAGPDHVDEAKKILADHGLVCVSQRSSDRSDEKAAAVYRHLAGHLTMQPTGLAQDVFAALIVECFAACFTPEPGGMRALLRSTQFNLQDGGCASLEFEPHASDLSARLRRVIGSCPDGYDGLPEPVKRLIDSRRED